MEHKKGIAFFDLDGTLAGRQGIPESALKALEELRPNYWVVLSTGRDMDSWYSVKYRDMVNADAIVHLNGSKITVGGEVLQMHYMDTDLLHEIYDFCTENGLCVGVTIGEEDFFINPEKKFKSDTAYLKPESTSNQPVPNAEASKDNSKNMRRFTPFEQIFERSIPVIALNFAGDMVTEKAMIEEHFPNLRLFPYNNSTAADIVELGFTKAEGLKKLCAYYNIPVENTYAFGDSYNDIAILEVAGHGIAMGNGDQALKDVAEYITDEVYADGIYNACKHFGLI